MKLARAHLLLYAVTDRAWLRQQTLEEQVEAAIKGGVTCVQLREKELGEDAFLKEAFSIRDVCKKRDVPFIVNDNVEIAIKCGADGAHIGQGDMPLREARMLAGVALVSAIFSAKDIESECRALRELAARAAGSA